MRTIHHDAKVIPARYIPASYIPAHDEHIYEYGELSEEAKQHAFDEWEATGANMEHFNSDLDEILSAVKDFSGYVGVGWDIDAWHNISFCFTDETEYATFSDNGFYASMDIADAWNPHVDTMLELYIAYQDAEYGAASEAAYRALRAEVDSALDDVRRVTQRNINDSWDYWIYEPEKAFEAECGIQGFEFDEDGDLYAA